MVVRRLAVATRVVRICAELGVIGVRRVTVNDVAYRSTKIREALTRLGPAFVKLGQALSTRRDMLPAELCVELARLQDDMPTTLSGERAMDVIARELGASACELFDGLDASTPPVAAASLGQVYKARVKSTGEVVAVKVQREGVAELVALDAVAVRHVARALGWYLGSRTDLAVVTDEIVGRIVDEMDYRREARDAERFAEYFAQRADCPGVVIPRVLPELSSSKVLTLAWVDGLKLDVWGPRVDRAAAKRVIENGVRCTVEQFFKHGFFHADPHPGNLLVTNEGMLAYLDFGKMGELHAEDRLKMMLTLARLGGGLYES